MRGDERQQKRSCDNGKRASLTDDHGREELLVLESLALDKSQDRVDR